MNTFITILKLATIAWLIWATVIGVCTTKNYRRETDVDTTE